MDEFDDLEFLASLVSSGDELSPHCYRPISSYMKEYADKNGEAFENCNFLECLEY